MNKHAWKYRWLTDETDLSNTENWSEESVNSIGGAGRSTGVNGAAKLTANAGMVVNMPIASVSDSFGRVIETASATVDLSVDENSIATVPGAGQERWAVVAVEYEVQDSNSQIDPVTGLPFFLHKLDGYKTRVVAGTAAAPGLAVPPTVGDAVIVGGVLLVNGQVAVTTQNLTDGDTALIAASSMDRGDLSEVDESQIMTSASAKFTGMTTNESMVKLLAMVAERQTIFSVQDIDDNTPATIDYRIGDASAVFSGYIQFIAEQFSPYHYTEMPRHTHTASSSTTGAHVHGNGTLAIASGGVHSHGNGTLAVSSSGSHTHATSGTAASAGDHQHLIKSSGDNVLLQDDSAAGSNAYVPGFKDEPGAEAALTSHGGTIGAWGSLVAATTGAHAHTTSGTAASNGAHTHPLAGTVANSTGHTHAISGAMASTGDHSHTVTVTSSGLASTAPWALNTTTFKRYLDTMIIKLDGTDVTANFLTELTLAKLGDGTAAHAIYTAKQTVNMTNINVGAGLLAGNHSIEFSVASGGGKIRVLLNINDR